MRTELEPAVQSHLGEETEKYLHELEEEERKTCQNTTKERGEEERDKKGEDTKEEERKPEENVKEEEERDQEDEAIGRKKKDMMT